MLLADVITEYLRYLLTQRGSSPNTVRTYQSALRRCLEASAAIGVASPDLTTIDRRWANLLVQELGAKLRPRTVHRNITACRSLIAYAVEEGYVASNPFAGVRLPKKDAVQRVPVTTEDLNALLAATSRLFNPVRGRLAHAVILTASTTALRYSELMALQISDIDLDARTLLVRKGKGNKSRVIPLPKQTGESIACWVSTRREWLDGWESDRIAVSRAGDRHREPTALWLADRGRRLGEDGLRRILRELSLVAGIDRVITIHDIRHSAATRMARQGMPLVGIQAILGHSNLTTTQTYIAGAGPHLTDWAEQMALPQETEPERGVRGPSRFRRTPPKRRG